MVLCLRHITFILEATPYIFEQPFMIEKAGKHFRTQPQAADRPSSCSSSTGVCFGRHARTEHNVPATAWLAGQWERGTEKAVPLPALRLAAYTGDLTKTGWGVSLLSQHWMQRRCNSSTRTSSFSKRNLTRVRQQSKGCLSSTFNLDYYLTFRIR